MEIIKNNIHMNRSKVNETAQLTIDDDFNVPDIKHDIIKIIQEKASVQFTEVRAMKDHIIINGVMKFAILYLSDSSISNIQSLSGEIPISETMNAEGAKEGDVVTVDEKLSDLSIRIINSRKINVKAIIDVCTVIEELFDEEVAVKVDDENRIECYNSDVECMQLYAVKKDVFRIKDEIQLPSSKPNIHEIVWWDNSIRGLETKPDKGHINIRGEVTAFILYICDDEENSMQWYETAVPFNGQIECLDCDEDMITDIGVRIINNDMDFKEDFDGEDRVITLDMVLELGIKIYREEKVSILTDAYALNKDLELVGKNVNFNSFVTKNNAKCKKQETVNIPKEHEKILQICISNAKVNIDRIAIAENGVEVFGNLKFYIIYVTSDDKVMLDSINDTIEFNHLIEVNDINSDCNCILKPGLEQFIVNVLDGEKVDIKATINMDLLVVRPNPVWAVMEINEGENNYDRLKDVPGIIAYIARPEDTLWKIAKENYTTVDNIKEINDIKIDKDSSLQGIEKLLLLKMISE